MRLLALALAAVVPFAPPALASSEDAWAQFRAEVEAACLAILEEPGEITVEVNPFGSQSFGAAIVTATSEGMGTQRMICIYDKATRAAELTAPF
ncbi:MAG: hypothetical protein ACT4OK_03310 [Gemmobacter sp.]